MLRMFEYLVKQLDLEKAKAVLSLAEENPEANLLDCGCSSGEFTLKLAETVKTRKVYGIDFLEASIKKARAKGIEAYQGDLNQKFPFYDESFDVVLANHVIEHLCHTDLFLKEVYRVLKVGGYTIIATPNLAAFYNTFYLLLGRQPYIAMVSDEVLAGSWMPLKGCISSENHGPAHRRIFTLGALKGLLEYHGFTVERTIGSGFFPLPFPLAKVLCVIDKRHATDIAVKVRRIGERDTRSSLG